MTKEHFSIGDRVGIDNGVEGSVTAIRKPYPLPALTGGEIRELQPYIEIDNFIQAHPSRVKKIDKIEQG